MNVDNTTLALRAGYNFRSHIGQNSYPGDGFVIGRDKFGNIMQVYWGMDRNDDGLGRLFRQTTDGRVLSDTPLMCYNAMQATADAQAFHVVGNGDQTDVVVEQLDGLGDWPVFDTIEYKKDAPHFTSRITGVSLWDEGKARGGIWIVRKSPWNKESEDLLHVFKDLPLGFGLCVTTYMKNGDPLPPFQGEPLLMPLQGTIDEVAKTYWAALDRANRIALAVKVIPEGGTFDIVIINRD